jgi:DNA gyrase subunit A
MDVGDEGEVIAMDVARDDMELLVVTEAGYGKRTKIDQYRKTSRGAKGVLTIKLTEAKGGLAGALVVRPHQELVFISQNGLIQRTGVKGISQQGRSATGVRVMNPRDGDQVSAVALIVESEDDEGTPTLDVDGAEIEVVAQAGDVEVAVLSDDLADDEDDADDDEIGPEAAGPDGATAEDADVEED